MGNLSNIIMLDKMPLLEYVIHDVLMRQLVETDKEKRIAISTEVLEEMRDNYPVMIINHREYALVPLKGEPTWLTD